MHTPAEPLHVGMLPRAPFLAHSEELLQLLLGFAPAECRQVLEIGCGPSSPLLPMLLRRWPEADVHQIDARPDVVLEAVKHNPTGRVEQMLASDMAAVATASKQLVVAMSVFDQNAEDLWPGIAREVHRVLAPDGVVVYIHNEELNLPSTAASLLRRSAGETVLLPSDRWRPGNDLEYCSGARHEIETALRQINSGAGALAQYLRDVYPQLYTYSRAEKDGLRVPVPNMRDYTYPVMDNIRSTVSQLRERYAIRLDDLRTLDLLRNLVESGIFCEQHGFSIERSGMFEIRRAAPWATYFKERLPVRCVVRGTMHFGYAGNDAPPPATEYHQDLNRDAVAGDDEVLFIGYQYGMAARKR